MINSVTIPLFAHTDSMLQHLKCMQSLKSPATLMIFGCRLTLDPSNPCSSSLGMSWVLPYPLPSSCPASRIWSSQMLTMNRESGWSSSLHRKSSWESWSLRKTLKRSVSWGLAMEGYVSMEWHHFISIQGGSLCAPFGNWYYHCKEDDPSGGEASHQEADHHRAEVNMTERLVEVVLAVNRKSYCGLTGVQQHFSPQDSWRVQLSLHCRLLWGFPQWWRDQHLHGVHGRWKPGLGESFKSSTVFISCGRWSRRREK